MTDIVSKRLMLYGDVFLLIAVMLGLMFFFSGLKEDADPNQINAMMLLMMILSFILGTCVRLVNWLKNQTVKRIAFYVIVVMVCGVISIFMPEISEKEIKWNLLIAVGVVYAIIMIVAFIYQKHKKKQEVETDG